MAPVLSQQAMPLRWKIVSVAAIAVALASLGLRFTDTPPPATGEHTSTVSLAGVAGLQPGVPKIISVAELKDLATERGPIYWAGERDDTHIEATVTPEGGVYVRYLPDTVTAGSDDLYLTVGTYESVDGYDALAAANADEADVVLAESGAIITTFTSAPDSTYFAFPKTSFQVEVFSPESGQARSMTETGEIVLVPGQ